MRRFWLAIGLCALATVSTSAQTITTLYSFCAEANCADGEVPAGLIQGTDGNFYGTTETGGAGVAAPAGTVFKITAAGALTTLYTFCGANCYQNGDGPLAGVTEGKDGNLYGTTSGGGSGTYALGADGGTVFKLTTGGTFKKLHSFCSSEGCADGEEPLAGLVQAKNGDFYGTTLYGGTNANCLYFGTYECGTVFSITASGKLKTLYSFCAQSGCPDGFAPSTPLIQATNGDLYGTTTEGGTNLDCYNDSGGLGGCGTVFRITLGGALTTIYNFCALPGCRDGAGPTALMQASDGNFYGATGGMGRCNGGTVFKLTVGGKLTTLYSFAGVENCGNLANGAFPAGPLIQGKDGNFYGTTSGYCFGSGCEAGSSGTIFKITPTGKLTTLYSFCSLANCADGFEPLAGVIQGTNGLFYGVTSSGGANDPQELSGVGGTVFSLSVP